MKVIAALFTLVGMLLGLSISRLYESVELKHQRYRYEVLKASIMVVGGSLCSDTSTPDGLVFSGRTNAYRVPDNPADTYSGDIWLTGSVTCQSADLESAINFVTPASK